ncbi:MAG TPA: hypothetical protein VKU85_08230, partial [bacterium]|nr:hypothetical protein [bacterium]
LTAAGTAEAPVELTGSGTVWDGLRVLGTAELRHVRVRDAATGVRVEAGGDLDLLCGDLDENDVGVRYAGGAGTRARVRGTRLANRLANLVFEDGTGLQVGGATADRAGWNEFVLGSGPDAANLDATGPIDVPPVLTGNLWRPAAGAEPWGLGSLRQVQESLRGVEGQDVFLVPLLTRPPETCEHPDLAPEPPPADVPARFDFARAIPNPVRNPITVDFDVPAGFLGNVIVDVYDVRGALVRNVVDRFTYAGRHSAPWDLTDDQGRRVAAGVYFLRMETLEFARSRKILVLR